MCWSTFLLCVVVLFEPPPRTEDHFACHGQGLLSDDGGCTCTRGPATGLKLSFCHKRHSDHPRYDAQCCVRQDPPFFGGKLAKVSGGRQTGKQESVAHLRRLEASDGGIQKATNKTAMELKAAAALQRWRPHSTPVVAFDDSLYDLTLPTPLQPLPEPTKKRPLVFFHEPKTAGTSLRLVLYKAAVFGNLSSVVVCHSITHSTAPGVRTSVQQRLSCSTYDRTIEAAAVDSGALSHLWRDWSDAAIIGGHFSRSLSPLLLRGRRGFTCITMAREPTSRYVSYYYERIFHHHTNVTLSQLPPSDVRHLLTWMSKGIAGGSQRPMASWRGLLMNIVPLKRTA
jgi:hypothetical protein